MIINKFMLIKHIPFLRLATFQGAGFSPAEVQVLLVQVTQLCSAGLFPVGWRSIAARARLVQVGWDIAETFG